MSRCVGQTRGDSQVDRHGGGDNAPASQGLCRPHREGAWEEREQEGPEDRVCRDSGFLSDSRAGGEVGASLESIVGLCCPLWAKLVGRGSWGRRAVTCSHGWWWEVYDMTVKWGGMRELLSAGPCV